jgi:hypothetical protein
MILMRINSEDQHIYKPDQNEIMLASRALASMPYMILKKKNPIISVEPE